MQLLQRSIARKYSTTLSQSNLSSAEEVTAMNNTTITATGMMMTDSKLLSHSKLILSASDRSADEFLQHFLTVATMNLEELRDHVEIHAQIISFIKVRRYHFIV